MKKKIVKLDNPIIRADAKKIVKLDNSPSEKEVLHKALERELTKICGTSVTIDIFFANNDYYCWVAIVPPEQSGILGKLLSEVRLFGVLRYVRRKSAYYTEVKATTVPSVTRIRVKEDKNE